VEASAGSYAALKRSRPEQATVHVAVCDKPSVVHYADGGADCCRGIPEFMERPFLESWHPSLVGGDFSPLRLVACVPLQLVLDRFGVQHVNFFVLDVEGAELRALQSLNFDLVSFDVIVIEADGISPTNDRAVQGLLRSHGYKHHKHDGYNDWFVREGFEPSSGP
jgi:hypothetical protein